MLADVCHDDWAVVVAGLRVATCASLGNRRRQNWFPFRVLLRHVPPARRGVRKQRLAHGRKRSAVVAIARRSVGSGWAA
jgi:hypothetical protein